MKRFSPIISLSVLAVVAVIAFSIYTTSGSKDYSAAEPTKTTTVINPPPTTKDWADLGKLPDWSGVWNPKITDQDAQVKTNPPPWNEQTAKKVQQMFAEEKAGRPLLIFPDCLPEAHPSWMLITHNAMEILFTPGRVTMLGESDGNRLRRIYTDGRSHPDVPDPTFHGHSIGRWEGNTLVVDTVHILPQVPLAISEAAGVPNNGDMRVVERIYLADKDILHVDLEIFAPKIFTKPWKTTRIFFRQRARKFDIVEGVCVQGNLAERVNKDGDHIFVPVEKTIWGNVVPPN
jgi:hypothetical protein